MYLWMLWGSGGRLPLREETLSLASGVGQPIDQTSQAFGIRGPWEPAADSVSCIGKSWITGEAPCELTADPEHEQSDPLGGNRCGPGLSNLRLGLPEPSQVFLARDDATPGDVTACVSVFLGEFFDEGNLTSLRQGDLLAEAQEVGVTHGSCEGHEQVCRDGV